MKRSFCFLFVLLFVQASFGLAKEPSFYEEFDQQEELSKQEEKKNAEMPLEFSLVPPAENAAETQGAKQDKGEGKLQGELPKETDFFLTDEKHAHFLQENEQYALADSMLNQTWKLLIKKLNKKEYRKLWQGHKVWLDSGRNTVANKFKTQVPAIPESHAFMLAAVAKTQDLAREVWHEPVLGRYVKEKNFVTLTKEDDKIVLQGYGNVPVFANNQDKSDTATKEEIPENAVKSQADSEENTAQAETEKKDIPEKQAEKNTIKTMPQLLFRAELPAQEKLWLALETINKQKLYLLTAKDSLCIVHAPHSFSFDFNGVFVKK